MNDTAGNLKNMVISEMVVDYGSALEKSFNIAKKLIKITQEGKIDVLHKDSLTGKENISLYLIGKLYAKEADLVSTNEVSNQELLVELGIPKGSLLPWLKDLRDENRIRTITRGKFSYHIIASNFVEKTLKEIIGKVQKEEKIDDN